MKQDNLFWTDMPRSSDFEFNDEVAEIFDDMLLRSIPFYWEQQYMIRSGFKTPSRAQSLC